jgi:hypothetical protein
MLPYREIKQPGIIPLRKVMLWLDVFCTAEMLCTQNSTLECFPFSSYVNGAEALFEDRMVVWSLSYHIQLAI